MHIYSNADNFSAVRNRFKDIDTDYDQLKSAGTLSDVGENETERQEMVKRLDKALVMLTGLRIASQSAESWLKTEKIIPAIAFGGDGGLRPLLQQEGEDSWTLLDCRAQVGITYLGREQGEATHTHNPVDKNAQDSKLNLADLSEELIKSVSFFDNYDALREGIADGPGKPFCVNSHLEMRADYSFCTYSS